MTALSLLTTLATLLWFTLFSPWTAGLVNFWGGMAVSAALLTLCSLFAAREEPPSLLGGIAWTLREAFHFKPAHILIGLLAAALLYDVFFIGNWVSNQLFDFARPQIKGIYGTKTQASALTIGALLLFLIGPAEEIFWRGYIQRNLSKTMGGWKGLVVATLIYALIHIWSFNFMLIMAALICGLFWALMYRYYKSLWPGIISHAVWDVAIFVIWPIK
jgi:membrane protease YdiL (CAAX protease family)